MIQKYKKALIIFAVYIVLVIILLQYGSYREAFNHGRTEMGGLTQFIPTNSMYIELMLIFTVLTPLSALIGGLGGGYLLAPAFLVIHKRILGSRMLYGIEDRPQSSTFNKMSRVYYPALFSISVNFIILFSAPWIINQIIRVAEGPIYSEIYMPGFLVLSMFTMGLGTLFFSPTWFLTDAGIVYSNVEKVAGTDEPVEGRTVGGRFKELLRGYAGIAVLVSYVRFLSIYVGDVILPAIEEGIMNAFDIIGTFVFFFGTPIFMLIATIPALIILDITKEHRIRFIRSYALRLGISDFVEISFQKVKP